ncbi:DUF3592 domain-containing protein [Anaerosporobacter sp.]|uniref:DUF3592 domain-containing protein n=1 Tax=Anaerosporobacter sp. TaxID=1872529 RepID=UPI00286F64D0|nr:DUF3592 domain-containing protein [Anaerosporobacter sp.]
MKKILITLLGIACILFAVLAIIGTIDEYISYEDLKKTASKTTGTIAEIEREYSENSRGLIDIDYIVTVKYNHERVEYTGIVTYRDGMYKGEKTNIYYNRDNTNEIYTTVEGKYIWKDIVLFIAILIVGILWIMYVLGKLPIIETISFYRAIGVLFVFAGVYACIVNIDSEYSYSKFNKTSKEEVAVVNEVEVIPTGTRRTGGSKHRYKKTTYTSFVQITYQVNGISYTQDLKQNDTISSLSKGDKISIFYYTDNPYEVQWAVTKGSRIRGFIVTLILEMALTAIGIVIILKDRKSRKARIENHISSEITKNGKAITVDSSSES